MNDEQIMTAESLAPSPSGWCYAPEGGGSVWVGDSGDAWEIFPDGGHDWPACAPTDEQAAAAERDPAIAHPIRAEFTTDGTEGRGLLVIIDAHGVAHEYDPDGYDPDERG